MKSSRRRFALAFTPWRIWSKTFEYLPGKTNIQENIVADTLSHLDIDSLKIQEETK
jgi:hypothetical protein